MHRDLLLLLLLSPSFIACGGALSAHDPDGCRSDPKQFNASRSGVVTQSYPALSWDSPGSGDPLIQVTETRRDCLYDVTVTSPAGQYK